MRVDPNTKVKFEVILVDADGDSEILLSVEPIAINKIIDIINASGIDTNAKSGTSISICISIEEVNHFYCIYNKMDSMCNNWNYNINDELFSYFLETLEDTSNAYNIYSISKAYPSFSEFLKTWETREKLLKRFYKEIFNKEDTYILSKIYLSNGTNPMVKDCKSNKVKRFIDNVISYDNILKQLNILQKE